MLADRTSEPIVEQSPKKHSCFWNKFVTWLNWTTSTIQARSCKTTLSRRFVTQSQICLSSLRYMGSIVLSKKRWSHWYSKWMREATTTVCGRSWTLRYSWKLAASSGRLGSQYSVLLRTCSTRCASDILSYSTTRFHSSPNFLKMRTKEWNKLPSASCFASNNSLAKVSTSTWSGIMN